LLDVLASQIDPMKEIPFEGMYVYKNTLLIFVTFTQEVIELIILNRPSSRNCRSTKATEKERF